MLAPIMRPLAGGGLSGKGLSAIAPLLGKLLPDTVESEDINRVRFTLPIVKRRAWTLPITRNRRFTLPIVTRRRFEES